MSHAISGSEAAMRVIQRYGDCQGRMFELFEQLDVGWTKEDLLEWLSETPLAKDLDQAEPSQFGNAVGLAISLAALVVEKERDG